MYKQYHYSKKTILLAAFSLFLLCGGLSAQSYPNFQIFSRFEFNDYPLTQASIGPDATHVDTDAVTDGVGIYMQANCVSIKGFDLTIPTNSGIFDQPEMGMTFRFQRDESFANFFNRGGTSFYIQAGLLWVQYQTSLNGAVINNGPFLTGVQVPNDNSFREYTFEYTLSDGRARVFMDGNQVWQNNGPNNRPLYWPPNEPVFVGEIMDGTCSGMGVLDYAYFYVPTGAIPALPVEWAGIDAKEMDSGIEVSWGVTSEVGNDYFTLERSLNGGPYQSLSDLPSAPENHNGGQYQLVDDRPVSGNLTYRIRQTDLNGDQSWSEAVSLDFSEDQSFSFTCYPNPVSDNLKIDLQHENIPYELCLTNSFGQVLERRSFPEGKPSGFLDLSGYPTGLYLLTLRAEGKTHYRKIKKI